MAEDSLLREIDDELRQEHYARLWKKYGHYVIGVAVLIVVVVAGYKGWEYYSQQVRLSAGADFVAAQDLAADGKTDEALAAYREIIADSSAGYSLLARFRAAGLQLDKGDRVGALESYEAIAAESDLDRKYRDLAVLLAALIDFDNADDNDLRLRLEPITADDNPWRFLARELSALSYLRSGDRDKGKALLSSLVDDPQTPPGVRARSRERLSMLEG